MYIFNVLIQYIKMPFIIKRSPSLENISHAQYLQCAQCFTGHKSPLPQGSYRLKLFIKKKGMGKKQGGRREELCSYYMNSP